MSDTKVYLGDGVYLDRWHDGIVLTTENGIEVGNTIYLEPEVVLALVKFIKRMGTTPKDAS